MQIDLKTYRLTDPGKLGMIALVVGILGLLVSILGFTSDRTQFFYSYLVAFVFWTSIGLGGLFFTMLHHLADAKWSMVLRRISESVMSTLPLMGLFAIPLLFGIHDLYHSSHADVMATDELLKAKEPFLNQAFFIIRTVGYFVIWSLLTFFLFRNSVKQDSVHSDKLTAQWRRVSAPGMILFAVTSTFAAFDWLMSLDPHWYSTIYGVYMFTGGFLAAISFIILSASYQRRQGILKEEITIEHYHDLGKLLFGFLVFWAYMAFSQYFLIWYANIPEETVWFLDRWENAWKSLSLLMIFGHFAFPFLALLTRGAKRSVVWLSVMSCWILFMRWVDIYWLAMPTLHEHGPQFSWIDLSTMCGIGGIFIWYCWRKYTSHPVLPVNDPGLKESLEFVNN